MYTVIKETINRYHIWLNNPRLKQYHEKYKNELNDYLDSIKKHARIRQKRKTINDNILKKNLNWYCTFTLMNDKEKLSYAQIVEGLTKMLKRYNIHYILVAEYGDENDRLHFHGFINVPDNDLMQLGIVKSTNRIIRDKYGNLVYMLKPIENNYGFTRCIDINKVKSYAIQKIINYCISYIIDTDKKVLSSRFKKDNELQEITNLWFKGSNIIYKK